MTHLCAGVENDSIYSPRPFSYIGSRADCARNNHGSERVVLSADKTNYDVRVLMRDASHTRHSLTFTLS